MADLSSTRVFGKLTVLHEAIIKANAEITGTITVDTIDASSYIGLPTEATRWPEWGEVTGKPSSFPPISHTHQWGDLTGVPSTATRWPTWSEVTSKPSFSSVATSGSYTDLSNTPNLSTVATTGSYNDLVSRPGNVTTSTNGFMSSSDKSKLDGIESGAQVNVGDEFNNSGDYSNLRARATTKDDVGLSNVDNYSRSHYDNRYALKTGDTLEGHYQFNRDGGTFGSDDGQSMTIGYPANWSTESEDDHVALKIQTNGSNDSNYPYGVVGIRFSTSTSSNFGPFIGGTRTGGGNGDLVIKTGGNSVQERLRVKDNGDIDFTGTLSGNGSGLNSLNASNLSSGTVPNSRLPSDALIGDTTYNAGTGINLSGTTFSLSDERYTSSEKSKLSGIESGAQVNVPTDLASNRNSTSYTIASSTGDNTTLSGATSSVAGIMVAADKNKLDGIESGAQVNTVDSVAGKTGSVALNTNDVSEGGNLYYTTQRARNAISVSGDLSYNSSTGVISFNETYSNASDIKTAYESNSNTNAFTDSEKNKLSGIESGAEVNTVSSVAGKTGNVALDTGDIPEGSNLYHTALRAINAIKGDSDWNASNWDTAYSWGDHSQAGYQDELVSGTNIKTVNGQSILGSGNVDVGGGFYVGVNPPSNPSNGDPWWNSEDGKLYVYYDDGESSQWVISSPIIPGPRGERGFTGTVGVVATNTLGPESQASVVNIGTVHDALLEFNIPKGEKGDKGDPGGANWDAVDDKPDTATRWPTWEEVDNKPSMGNRDVIISTEEPDDSQGNDGDIWLRYEE